MSIEASTSVDPFARTCQAAHLLGWVCTHVNQNPSASEADMHFQEAFTISGALRALATMLSSESSQLAAGDRQRLFAARGLAYAALNTLYDVHSCIEADNVEAVGGNRGLRLDLQQHALDGFKEVINEVSAFAAEIEQYYADYGVDKIPVMVLFSLYTVGGTYAWYARENAAPAHFAALADLRRVMDIIGSTRWPVACKYFDLMLSLTTTLFLTHALTPCSHIPQDAGRHGVLIPRWLQTVKPRNRCIHVHMREEAYRSPLHHCRLRATSEKKNSGLKKNDITTSISPLIIFHPHHPLILSAQLADTSGSGLHSVPTAPGLPGHNNKLDI